MSTAKLPHVILIVLDTLRADRLSCYGYPQQTTPNLDRLAQSGLLFENTLTSAPWTLPSQSSLLTGRHPFQHGSTETNPHLDNSVPTLAELLKKIGYQTTVYALDNGWLSNATNILRGFDQVFDATFQFPPTKKPWIIRKFRHAFRTFFKVESRVRTQWILNHAAEKLKKNTTGDMPQFMYINIMDTHLPYHPAFKFRRKFGLKNTDPHNVEYLQKSFKQIRSRPEDLSDKQLLTLQCLYDACVATADYRLAKLLKILQRPQLRDNSILVVTSDHGEHLGEHGLLNHWFSLHDILLKVPLIISYPKKISQGQRIKPQIQQHNLMYTLLDLIGYQDPSITPELIKTNSLLEIAAGNIHAPEFTYAEHDYPVLNLQEIRRYNPEFNDENLISPKQAIRTNQFKYIKYDSGLKELFNLEKDPGETTDVITQYPKVAEILKNQLTLLHNQSVIKQKNKINISEFDPEVKKRLSDLGYI